MANRFTQELRAGVFRPVGALPGGVIDVAAPDGSANREAATALDRLASQLGTYADELAVAEGERAGREAGNDPDYRPEGRMTLRGRAYERAALSSYVDNLQADLRRDMAAAYEEFAALPASDQQPSVLAATFQGIRERYRRERVFADIEGDFESQFAVWETSYRKGAVDAFLAREQDAARAATLSMISASQTGVARAVIAAPNAPETEAILLQEREARERSIRGAVARGDITAVEGERLIADAQRTDALALEEARLQRAATIADVDAYERAFRERVAAGGLDVLGAEGLLAVESAIGTRRRAILTQGTQAANTAERLLDDIVKRAERGFDIPPEELARTRALVLATPGGEALVALADRKLMVAAAARGRSPEEIDNMVGTLRLRAQEEGADPATADLIGFAEKLAQSKREDLATDLVGVAQRDRLTTPTAIDPGSPELSGQIAARVAAARSAAAAYGRAPQFLRPDEKERLASAVAAGGDAALTVAEQIVRGAGNDAPRVLREIGGDAPHLAAAGAILASGGSRQAARDLFEARRMVAAAGRDALPQLPAIERNAARSEEIGAAFIEHPTDGSRIVEAAGDIAGKRMAELGMDPADGADIYRRALQEAAGARFIDDVQYGGVASYRAPRWYWGSARVAVPGGVRADRFDDLIGAITDADLASLPTPPATPDGKLFTASDLHGATPVASAGGYRFILGDVDASPPRYVTLPDGSPFRLEWARIAPRLRERMPDAFLGGE